MVKRVAVYGTYQAELPVKVKERVWIIRKDGVRQRYWKKVERLKLVEMKGRYEFEGGGKALYRAVRLAHRFMPRGFVTVSAEEFIEHPEEYGFEGEWIEREVES